MIIGIIGNGMTLRIIWKLNKLENGHMLMTYSAVSEIIVNCLVPYETYTAVMGALGNEKWKSLCTWQDVAYIMANGASVISHFFMSVDR